MKIKTSKITFKNLRHLLIVLPIAFTSLRSEGQETQSDELNKTYSQLITSYLIPPFDTTKYYESLVYIENPSFNPEFSIRILQSKNEILLEGYFFKTSLSGQLMMNLIENRLSPAKPVVTHHTTFLNSDLASKIIRVVDLMVDQQYNQNDCKEIPVDGTDYYFNISKKSGGKNIRFHSSELNTMRKEVVTLFSQISFFLRSDTINHTEIYRTINKIIK